MRSDVSLAFVFAYAAILFGRALWLGDPWAIPLKQLQSGALLLFTFFMPPDLSRVINGAAARRLPDGLSHCQWRSGRRASEQKIFDRATVRF